LILLKNTLNGKKFEIITNDEKIKAMSDLLNDEKIDFNYMPPHNSLNFFSRLGEKICEGFVNLLEFGSFLGEFLIKSVRILFNPANLRFREFSNYIKDGGVMKFEIKDEVKFFTPFSLMSRFEHYFATKNLSEFEREFNDLGAIWSVNLNEAEFAELFNFCKEFEASEFKFLALPLGSKALFIY